MKEKKFDAIKMTREIRERQSAYYNRHPERFRPDMERIYNEIQALGIAGYFAQEDAKRKNPKTFTTSRRQIQEATKL